MRVCKLWIVALVAIELLTGTLAGCKAKRRTRVETVEEEAGPLASVVKMSDPRTAVQLVRGFYGLEQGAWRWTKSEFSVTLRPPNGSAQAGARLEIHLTVPEAVLAKVGGSTALSCTVGGQALEPKTYSKAGDFAYARDVSPSVLTADAASFDCKVSKFLAAGQVEERELALIVLEAGLVKK
ncbi:MAG: hypothetical protein FJW31_20065 [Acidobacteria bacterium]|nr:hypothetical protein [Acidobacteriota bacterium]